MSRSSTEPSDLERSAERYERLLEIQTLMARVSREIGPALDLEQVLATVLRAVRSLLEFDGGSISLLEGEDLVLVATDPARPDGRGRAVRQRRSTGLAGAVLGTGRSARYADVATDERLDPATRARAVERGVASFLCVPLVSLGDAIGVIQVYSERPGAFGEDDELLLEGLATQVAGAIESARRYQAIAQLEVLKSDFIARVSHELRTPITIVSGFVSTLLANHERLDAGTRRQMLERVDVATARLSGLIDQLLMLSRLEAGVVAANPVPVDAAELLAEVQRQAETPEAVAWSSTEDLRFSTDPGLLLRALGFLVDNSLKYAGSCRIVAEEGCIEVLDEGPGIPPGQRSHVFERFTRATEDTTVPGMGIGLPMARTLLAAAGADLAIEDPIGGRGTRMVIRFW